MLVHRPRWLCYDVRLKIMTSKTLRILLGVILPILIVGICITTVCDIFYANKDQEYTRLKDATFGWLVFSIIWSCLIAVTFFALPSLLLSWLIEYRRSNKKWYLPISLSFGLAFGLFTAYTIIPPVSECSSSDLTEGFFHVLTITLGVGLVTPFILSYFKIYKPRKYPIQSKPINAANKSQ